MLFNLIKLRRLLKKSKLHVKWSLKIPVTLLRKMQNTRRRRHVVGDNDLLTTIRGVPWFVSLHATRLDPVTKPEELKYWLFPEFPEVKCEPHSSKHSDCYASMNITIYQNNLNKAWMRDIWPVWGVISLFFQPQRGPIVDTGLEWPSRPSAHL